MKRFTVGITAFNEEKSIADLLDSLLTIPEDLIDVIVYDDCSTDATAEIVRSHRISGRSNFRFVVAEENNGTPSVGRTTIGELARTEYVTLIDGDDMVDTAQLLAFATDAPSGQDIIITSYRIRDRRIEVGGDEGEIFVNNDNVSKIVSGIGGKSYRTELLREFGPDPVKGRSDDVRLNMRIISAEPRAIFYTSAYCYYVVHESRKSLRAKSLNFFEIESRLVKYRLIQDMYGLDNGYPISLKRQLLSIAKSDPDLNAEERAALANRVRHIFAVAGLQPANAPRRRSNLPSRVKHADKASKELGRELRKLVRQASSR